MERGHIVQAVGKLDENHTQVLAHSQEHFAQIFDALLLLGFERDPNKLGHAVDDFRDVAAEFAADHSEVIVAGTILHNVVEEGSADGIGVQLQIGHNFRNSDRMDDIRLTRAAHLPAMVFLGHRIGFFHFFKVIPAGLRQPVQQCVDVGYALRLRGRALQLFFHIRHACSFSFLSMFESSRFILPENGRIISSARS